MTIQNKLQTLEARGFIGKHYDKSYKLAGRAAEYFLTPKGARQLPADSTNEWAIKALYKNKTVSPEFITHCLNVADTVLTLQAIYGEKLGIFTSSQLAPYEYFPTWKPNLFLSFKRASSKKPRRYFLDVWDDTKPFFVSVRKARSYINYATDGKRGSNTSTNESNTINTHNNIYTSESTRKRTNNGLDNATRYSSEFLNLCSEMINKFNDLFLIIF